MKARLRNVDAIMPPATAVPTECRASWPAPLANTSGMTPRMKASDVIRIGRSRMRAASTAASAIVIPRWRSCSANSTIRMPFFADRPISITSPIWQYTSLMSPRPHCAASAPRMASGTDSRMMNGSVRLSYCAASVRYTSSRPRPKMIVAWLPAAISSRERPAHANVIPCGSTRADNCLHRLQRLARAVAGRGRPVDRDRAEQVVVVDGLRRGAPRESRRRC